MPIRFHCPKCHVRLSVAQRKAGQSSPCPNCRQLITIPMNGELTAEAAMPGGDVGSTTDKSNEPSKSRPRDQVIESPAMGTTATEPQSGSEYFIPQPEPVDDSWQTQSAIRELEPDLDRPSYLASVAANVNAENAISLPRWVVYFQAGMLAIVATTFFLLGLMINSKSDGPDGRTAKLYDCQLTGNVVFERDGRKMPDEGAVVIVVPVDSRILERPDPTGLRPDEFEAGENPSIRQIESVGGRVVRINQEGAFDLTTLRGPREYFVLIISRAMERPAGERIPKSTSAEIGGYFFPVEDLIGDKKFFLTRLPLNRRSQNLPVVVF